MDLQQSLVLLLPEEVLSVSGLALLLAAAWMGDKGSRTISILACVALGAAFFLVAPAVCGGMVPAKTPSPSGSLIATWLNEPPSSR